MAPPEKMGFVLSKFLGLIKILALLADFFTTYYISLPYNKFTDFLSIFRTNPICHFSYMSYTAPSYIHTDVNRFEFSKQLEQPVQTGSKHE